MLPRSSGDSINDIPNEAGVGLSPGDFSPAKDRKRREKYLIAMEKVHEVSMRLG